MVRRGYSVNGISSGFPPKPRTNGYERFSWRHGQFLDLASPKAAKAFVAGWDGIVASGLRPATSGRPVLYRVGSMRNCHSRDMSFEMLMPNAVASSSRLRMQISFLPFSKSEMKLG